MSDENRTEKLARLAKLKAEAQVKWRYKIADQALSAAWKIIKGAALKVIPGAPHGMCSTLKDQINSELLAFIQSERAISA